MDFKSFIIFLIILIFYYRKDKKNDKMIRILESILIENNKKIQWIVFNFLGI